MNLAEPIHPTLARAYGDRGYSSEAIRQHLAAKERRDRAALLADRMLETPKIEGKAEPAAGGEVDARESAIRRRVNSADVRVSVSARFDITVAELIGCSRMQNFANARFCAALVMQRFLGMSLPQIGRRLGDRDSTTALNAVRRGEEIMGSDDKFRDAYNDVVAGLGLDNVPAATIDDSYVPIYIADHTIAVLAAVTVIAANGDRLTNMPEIADRLGINRRRLVEYLRTIAAAGILKVVQGRHGGYRLRRPASEISLSSIICAIQTDLPGEAGTGPIAEVSTYLKRLRSQRDESLRTQTVADLLSQGRMVIA